MATQIYTYPLPQWNRACKRRATDNIDIPRIPLIRCEDTPAVSIIGGHNDDKPIESKFNIVKETKFKASRCYLRKIKWTNEQVPISIIRIIVANGSDLGIRCLLLVIRDLV